MVVAVAVVVVGNSSVDVKEINTEHRETQGGLSAHLVRVHTVRRGECLKMYFTKRGFTLCFPK